MEESGYRFGVGVLVMASAIIGVLLIAFFGAVPAIWVDRNRVSVTFESAPNVSVDTPVKKNGVLIGRVANISLLNGNKGVVVRMELDRKVELRKGELPRIARGSLITGDGVIEFVAPTRESLLARFDGSLGTPRDGELDAAELASADEIISDNSLLDGGEVAKDPFDSITRLETTVVPMLNKADRAFEQLGTLGKSLQQILGDGDGPITDVVASIKTASNNVSLAAGSFDRAARQFEQAEIPRAIAEALALFPELLKETQSTFVQIQRTLKGFEGFSASLEGLGKEFEGIGETVRKAVENANVAIENIAKITEPISQNSEVLVANAVRALADLDTLAVDLKRFTNRLNTSDGTIARLIDNPQLYIKTTDTLRNIQSASGNIELLTQRLQPILADVRILTDKVARDPGQLGVRGLLSNRPTGVGLK